jgi:2-dehydro-3-deoxyphosphogluconate aldolase/(4S)-4-hydroxy-2-oxoglutarate aldolase
MARFNRLQVLNTIINAGMVPLFYNKDAELCKQVVKACYKGGVRVFEFTNRGDFAHEVFVEIYKWAALECSDMILGVGSVVESGTASLYMQLGANFIVSPILNPELAKVCNRRKIAWIPGCATLTEINTAEELGAEIVKIFPANEIGGPSFIKNILGPCPWTSIMATGGVSAEPENLKSWFDAGASCVGLGSQLFPESLLKGKRFDELTLKIKETLEMVGKFKNRIN